MNKREQVTAKRYEVFAQRLAKGESAAEIYRDLYPKSRAWKPKTVWEQASRLTRKVSARVQELQRMATDATVADILERKRSLTEIVRGRVGHFLTVGADGVIPNVGPENINSAALKSVKSRCITMDKGNGKKDAVVTEIEIRDQVPAIAELNKMEGVYSPEKFEADITHSMIMKEPDPAPVRRKTPDRQSPADARRQISAKQTK